MSATLHRMTIEGYGQVELNKVAFRRTGRIEAQCALDTTDFSETVPAENGMLLRIDPVAHKVYLPDAATDKVLLNYTTEHMYDERTPGLKNFKLVPGSFLPRLGYLENGDVFTTNCVSLTFDSSVENAESTLIATIAANPSNYYGKPCTNGSIEIFDGSSASTNAVVRVVGKTTMPDGQTGFKFYVI